ncbi:MAG TPA: c-type cytochrome [Bryobacteraceae bacterium]|nr:c-type cytochrome [Bryobacteraceae bacterium]
MPLPKFRYGRIALIAFSGAIFAAPQTPPPSPGRADVPAPAERPAPATQTGRGGGRGGRSFLISRDVPDPAAVERGQALFVANCGFCHGSNANGGGEGGPDLIRSALALDDEKGDKIGPVIHGGRGKMPPFPQMTQAQIEDIAAFLRAKQQAAINRNAYTIQNVNTGNAAQGKVYFNEHCASCHSPSGDLAGIAGKYTPEILLNRIVYPGGRGGRGRGAAAAATTRVHPSVTVTANGRSFSGTLEYMDDFDVALRDASGEYLSFTRGPNVSVNVNDPLAGHEKLIPKYSDKDLHNVLAYLETFK